MVLRPSSNPFQGLTPSFKTETNAETSKASVKQIVNDTSFLPFSGTSFNNPQPLLSSNISNKENNAVVRKLKRVKSVAPVRAQEAEKFDKVVVVEVFSSFFDCSVNDDTVNNEIVGNTESGWNLAKKYHPEQRWIWSLNNVITEKLSQYAPFTTYKETVNLATDHFLPDNPLNLTARSKVIIVAQGNPEDEKIADLDANDFIDMLKDDLGITRLAELELIVCKLGRCQSYLDQIKEFFQDQDSTTHIVSYTSIISIDSESQVIGFDDIEEDEENETPLVYRWRDVEKIRRHLLSREAAASTSAS